MTKKFYIPLAIGLLVAIVGGVMVSGVALANDSGLKIRRHKAKTALGQVVEIDQGKLQIQTVQEKELSFVLTDETTIKDPEGNELSIDDLAIEKWVRVIFGKGDADELVAKAVILLPDDFDPANYERMRGLVSKINQSSQTIFLKTRNKGKVSIGFDENTKFIGSVDSFSKIEEGMVAGLVAEKGSGDSYLARIIRLRFPTVRVLGNIKDVVVSENTFTLITKRNEKEITVTIDENTRFKSRDGSVEGIEDLEPDMIAIVIMPKENTQESGNAQGTALAVIAGSPDRFPDFEWKMRGKVVEKNNNSVTIENPKGERFTIQVTEETKIRSKDNTVENPEQIETGMHLLVGGKELGNGNVQAEVIVVLPTRK